MNSILIAERDHSVREVLADVTREAFPGSTVHLARSGAEVLEILPRLRPPSAAVLHLGLAEECGPECLRRLREAQVPILLITAWDLSREASTVGQADDALQKPFDLADYLIAVKRLLDRRPPPTARA